MKRYLTAAGAVLMMMVLLRLPGQAMDTSELEPVETVLVCRNAQTVRIETDTGAWGEGTELRSAAQDLKRRTAGRIFLDTADYLLLDETSWDPRALRALFRPGCQVCIAQNVDDLQEAGRYLRIHHPDATLLHWAVEETPLQMLTGGKGGFLLE